MENRYASLLNSCNNKQHHVYDVDYTIIDSKLLSYTSRSQMTYVV